jgi:hypothetical protein
MLFFLRIQTLYFSIHHFAAHSNTGEVFVNQAIPFFYYQREHYF